MEESLLKDLEAEHIKIISGQHFTSREVDVISCLFHGRAVKTIASYLSISAKTVETHIRNVMGKLKCHSQESIRDFIEKSDKIACIRHHYLILQLRTNFEKSLFHIAKKNRQTTIRCLIVYKKGSKEDFILLSQLEKHLSLAGINISVKARDTMKFFNDTNYTPLFIPPDRTIYLLPRKLFVSHSPDGERSFLATKEIQNMDRKFDDFLLLVNVENNELCNELPPQKYINVFSYQSYYFLFFDILKKIHPSPLLESLRSDFEQNYRRLLSGMETFGTKTTVPSSNELKNNILQWHRSVSKKLKKITWQNWMVLTLASTLVGGIILYKNYADIKLQYIKDNPKVINSWNLPFPNLYFIGREEELKNIAEKFKIGDQKSDPITLATCTGLGGVGKTEIAKNFIHNISFHPSNGYNLRFWFSAENLGQLLESYSSLGQKLGITKISSPPEEIIAEIKNWFESHRGWLIVYDNAENFDSLINFIPHQGGHILITSRHRHWPNSVEINPMKEEDAISFVHKILGRHVNVQDIKLLVNRLKNLPLAISQAGAYILRNGKTIRDYLVEYDLEEKKLLTDDSSLPGLHHEPPSITWNININMIKEESNLAYEIINCLVYLYPDDIDRNHLVKLLQKGDEKIKSQVFNKAIQVLLSYSMVTYNQNNNTLSIHRLVQAVMWYRQLTEKTYKKFLSQVLNNLVKDREAHLVLGGLATRHETLKYIIQYYEEIPKHEKTPLLYHSLGCCYLVLDKFKQAESNFLASINLESNSAIHYEYGQALYLRKKYKEAIEQLKLSIEKREDNLFSYFSEMERPTVDEGLKREIDKIGTVRAHSSHLAYYLILKCYLETNMMREFQTYLQEFKNLVKSHNTLLLKKLLKNILSESFQ
jgi:DNA-binding CsgD family transcriptional regulator/tetratricopeptide (TPR) repeat protein